MFDRCQLRLACSFCVALILGSVGLARADVLDPLEFSSLGTLDLTSGSYVFNTDTLTIVDSANPGTPLFTGVVDNQDGAADYLNGVWVPGTNGIPEIAVFTFDDINLGAGATLSVVGNRALALLSQSDLVVATDLRLDAKQVVLTIDPGSGGFRGGLLGPLGPGEGPGGGPSKGLLGATGGFGGSGAPAIDNTGQVISAPGTSYGDLRAVLQGGSGGASGFYLTAINGGAGGGALELAAAGTLLVDATVSASAADWQGDVVPFSLIPGAGSGGGIRLSGEEVLINGAVLADGASMMVGNGSYQNASGGGRVHVVRRATDYFTGSIATLTDGISVAAGPQTEPVATFFPGQFGKITYEFDRLVVTPVAPIEFANSIVVQTQSETQPGLEVYYTDVAVLDRGEASVPVGGWTNTHEIELRGPQARIVGADPLVNQNELRGTGRVEVELTNDAGGQINAVNDSLVFTHPVDNLAGGQINAINSALDFQSGLSNAGELNLINTAILGSVSAAAGSATSFVGDNSVSGNLSLTAGNSLAIRIGGTSPDQFDTLSIGGNATLAGALSVSLQSGFTLSFDDTFEIVDIIGSTSGIFEGLGETALVGNYGGTDLFITYTGGDGNDVVLFAPGAWPGDYNHDGTVDGADYVVWRKNPGGVYTSNDYDVWRTHFGQSAGSGAALPSAEPLSATVPEPATLVLLMVTVAGWCFRRRRAA